MLKMRHNLFVITWAVMLTAGLASADYIAGTGFENEAVQGPDFSNYVKTGVRNPGDIEDLTNATGQPIIESTASSTAAGDLGFVAEYELTRLGDYFTSFNDEQEDYAVVGVINVMQADGTNIPGVSFAQSSVATSTKGYKMSDIWGILRLTFDPVDLTGHESVTCSLDVYIRSTTWEWDSSSKFDHLNVYLDTDDTDGFLEADVTIIDTSGSDIDTLSLEGKWNNGLSIPLADTVTSAQLVVEFACENE